LKIGGSLLNYPNELRKLCSVLENLRDETDFLIVPGGGVFADTVRDVYTKFKIPENISHQMAVLAMDQYGLLIHSFFQDTSQLIENIEDTKKCFEDRMIAILQVSKIMKNDNYLPKLWSVTSDSITALIAQLIKAERLILIKSIDGLKERESGRFLNKVSINSFDSKVSEGSVDEYFPNVLKSSPIQCFIVNGRFHERVESILRGDNTVYTKIIYD